MNPVAPTDLFSSKQLQELQEPLSSQAVKIRSQSGRNFSYIEGWYAISEANRIFGFDSWNQEIIELKCVSERERKIGKDQKDGWGVSYVASIRINVSGIKREGVGAGHGIDVDLGQAHESAIKEAATDAMKRALMTFGNQFGLALYDKEQRNVEDKPLNLEQVSESEKTAKKFVDVLLAKMEQVGINSDGIKTLKAILRLTDFEDLKEAVRPKLLERLTPEYAARLNLGQNARGEQVIQIVAKEIAQSTADLQKAADEVLS
jgi:DNA recombination protein Rad52